MTCCLSSLKTSTWKRKVPGSTPPYTSSADELGFCETSLSLVVYVLFVLNLSLFFEPFYEPFQSTHMFIVSLIFLILLLDIDIVNYGENHDIVK